LVDNQLLDGGRGAAGNGFGTTGAPAVVYVPSGTYIFDSPIQLFLDTVLIGNPLNLPVIKASAGFSGNTLIYAKDPSQDSTTNFYIGIKNIRFDSTAISASMSFTIIDW
jgi:glucan 1,3-beta-glucosidase